MKQYQKNDLVVAVLGHDSSSATRGTVVDDSPPGDSYVIEVYDDDGGVAGRHLVMGLQIALVRRPTGI